MLLRRGRFAPGNWPLSPLVPALVVLVGIAVALVMALLAEVQLCQTSDAGASEQAQLLGTTLALRLRTAASEDRAAILQWAGRRSHANLMLIDQRSDVLLDSDPDVGSRPSALLVAKLLVEGTGFTIMPTGRVAFAVQQLRPPLAHLALLVVVQAPGKPSGAQTLRQAVFFLALLLISVAALVAYTFSKNARDEVVFVRQAIAQMSSTEKAPAGKLIPIRTFDQVGVLASAFNVLVERFAAAERTYRQDLEQADALDRSRAQFLAALSHELRTPLNAILGFADVLLAEVEGPLTASAREDLEVVRSSGENLRALINDVLDLSAIELGSLRLEWTSVDLVPLAESVVREVSPLVAGRDLELVLTVEHSVTAWGDSRRVRQILTNLLSNAIKFTPQGKVSVAVRQEGAYAVLEVTDTGPGIPQAEQATIFEEYRQVGDAASRRKGTGLGLAITQRLTQMQKGRLSLVSEVGKGSIFRVELPVEQSA